MGDDVVFIVSRILCDALTGRLGNGLSRQFQRHTADLKRVRGKIDLYTTYRDQLLSRGTVRCEFEALTTDTPTNRLVRSALIRASTFPTADPRCTRLADYLGSLGIQSQVPDRRVSATLHLNRNMIVDRDMIFAARLLYDLALPAPGGESGYAPSPDIDVHFLRSLFEKAALGAYRKALPTWDVIGGRRLKWDRSDSNTEVDAFLPGMKTDIILRPPDTSPIIVDTKFNNIFAATQYHAKRLRSQYIYQIYSYVMSQQNNPEFGPTTRGVLLHPAHGREICETVTIQGHPIRFATINLWGNYREILDAFIRAVH
ncbi:5-methylcytosine restriction system specificity protein McrC [Corynebacterium cystitidis]|uniref:5-methylcytosine restriction system specificity protein McrC n=1 Tax=Corynebacterium cystitidis TaxID=35757 RepID=UPI0034E93DDC